MSKTRLFHLIYGIVLSLLLVACGICFMVACVDIYKSGPNPFNPESISTHFKSICVPVYITLGLLILSIPLNLFIPNEKARKKPQISKKQTLLGLYSRFDYTRANEEALHKLNKFRFSRWTLYTINVVLLVCGTILSLVYALNIENFQAISEEGVSLINSSIIAGSLVVLRYFLIPLIFSIALIFVDKALVSRELDILKASIKEDKAILPKDAPSNKTVAEKASDFFVKHKKAILITLRVVIILGAIALVVTGILNGGMYTVLQKANKLCQECIGLG
ncbi:MAG: hypothetical protein IJA82_00070 [Clostridia bacterium]|nr:hypothetical protein [Clostridia bacterium]